MKLEIVAKFSKSDRRFLRRLDARVSRILDLLGAEPSTEIVFGPIIEQVSNAYVRQPSAEEESIRMKRTQQVSGHVGQLVDRLGNPATLVGNARFSSSDPAVVEVTDNGDGSFVAKAVGLGDAIVKCEGDASSDEGEQPFLATGALSVTSGDVVGGTIEFDAPVEQP